MKNRWRGAIGLVLTIGLLWWVLREVKWAEVRHDVASANPLLAILGIAASFTMFPLRARRWRPILHPIAPNLPFGPLWRATAIGMMANMLLPARTGELVRAYVLARETPVPFSAGFASIVVDRVFDGVAVLLLMVLAMYSPAFPAGTLIGGQPASNYAGSGVLILVVAGLGLYAIVFFPDRLIGLFELFARRVAPRFEERGRQLLRSFADGLSVLRHPGRFIEVFFWALLHWVMQALGFWLFFRAMGIDAPYSAALFIQGLIVIGVALPSTPGFFGFFEAAAVLGLALYGVSNSLSVAWALSYHILSFIPITVVGLYYLFRSGVHLGDVKQLRE